MRVDTHIHTEFSSDSEMKLETAIEVARSKNLGIIITEHYDLDFPGEGFKCDIPNYLNTYEKYKSKDVMIGIEIGMAPSTVEANQKIAKQYPFDYILASIHGVDEVDIFQEYIYCDLEERIFYENYYKYMIKCLKLYDDFDSMAHIDYIHRYVSFKDPEIRVDDYKPLITEAMQVLIEKEKAMEINTRRMGNPTSRAALFEVYKLYKALGGKYVTIGSDSHGPDAIGTHFKEAFEIVDTLGLKAVYFRERKMEYCK